MTTARGAISRGEAGRLHEQLTGKVWLAQNPSQWPVTLMTSASQVVSWMGQNPDGYVWEYEIKPIRRVQVVRPEPYLQQADAPAEAAST